MKAKHTVLSKAVPAESKARRYFKEVRFRQIRSLVELARQGSFARTAAAMRLAVPSVWQQIRSLEDEYGVQLVTAEGSKVALTDDGRMLVDLAAPLVESFDGLRAMFQDRREGMARTLTVVAPTTMLSGPLRKPVILFRRNHPNVKLVLLDRSSYLARKVIEADEADVAVMGIATGDEPMPQYQCLPLARYAFHLMCPKGHPLLDTRKPTLASIVNEPLVLAPEESSSHRQVRRIFTQAGLVDKMHVIMTATNRTLQLSYVSIGFGIAISTSAASLKPPRSAIGEKEVIARDVSSLFGHEEVFFVQRKGRQRTGSCPRLP
ncbi:MAG: LysR family transcriptional regulator [Chryseolinea sp.]